MLEDNIIEMKLNNYPKPVTIEETARILKQMKKNISKIYTFNGNGTGFFCKIQYENKSINTFITNYHVINADYIKENKKINLSINDDSEIITININDINKRLIYSKMEYDITIIELKSEDNINDVYYLEIDEKIFQENSKIYYEGKTIYDLSYPNGGKASVSYGILKKFNEYNIQHLCSTDRGSSGSPLLNLENHKVVGIHRGGSNVFEFNKGTAFFRIKLPCWEIKKGVISLFQLIFGDYREDRKLESSVGSFIFLVSLFQIVQYFFKGTNY